MAIHEIPPPPSEPNPAVVAFVDLAGFTAVTEAHGDAHAVELVDIFEVNLTQDLPPGGRLVKMIGDAGLLVFDNAPTAVTGILRIANRTSNDLTFPELRAGLHQGPVIWRQGDPYGSTVNIASRIADQAVGGQILATSSVVDHLPPEGAIAVGRRKLKNVAAEVDLFEITTAAPPSYFIDPVCQMRLSATDVMTAVTVRSRLWHLCSPKCAALFLANPDAYLRLP